MTRHPKMRGCCSAGTGQTLVEFAVVTLMTVLMLLFVVEIARMVLVYTTIANAAHVGVRYAIVHGSTRPTTSCSPLDCASLANCPTGTASNTCPIKTVVKNFASTGLLKTSLLVVTVARQAFTAPVSEDDPGQSITITVMYPYDPLTTYFSKSMQLRSISQGVIVF